MQWIPKQIVAIGEDFHSQVGDGKVRTTLYEVRLEGYDKKARITIKLDRLIVLSKSSPLGWFLHVSLIVIIKGRSPMEVSLIVIINQV